MITPGMPEMRMRQLSEGARPRKGAAARHGTLLKYQALGHQSQSQAHHPLGLHEYASIYEVFVRAGLIQRWWRGTVRGWEW
jgi:hypothetical protein